MTTLEQIDRLFENHETKIAKDLKLNFKNLVSKSTLSPAETGLLLKGLARTTGNGTLAELGSSLLTESGENLSLEQLTEAEESAAIMGMLNVYYRFRHFMEEDGKEEKEAYKATALRMSALAAPALGKERFELLAFAHSVVNGCQKCVTSHEKSLLELGVSTEKIHDTARLAAVTTGLTKLILP